MELLCCHKKRRDELQNIFGKVASISKPGGNKTPEQQEAAQKLAEEAERTACGHIVLKVIKADLEKTFTLTGYIDLFASAEWEVDESSKDCGSTDTLWMCTHKPEWNHRFPKFPFAVAYARNRVTFEVLQDTMTGLGNTSSCGAASATIEELLGGNVGSSDLMGPIQELSLFLDDEATGTISVQASFAGFSSDNFSTASTNLSKVVTPVAYSKVDGVEEVRDPRASFKLAFGVKSSRRSRSRSADSSDSSDSEEWDPNKKKDAFPQFNLTAPNNLDHRTPTPPPCTPLSKLLSKRSTLRLFPNELRPPGQAGPVTFELDRVRSGDSQGLSKFRQGGKHCNAGRDQLLLQMQNLGRRLRVPARKYPRAGNRFGAAKDRFFAIWCEDFDLDEISTKSPRAAMSDREARVSVFTIQGDTSTPTVNLVWYENETSWNHRNSPLGSIALAQIGNVEVTPATPRGKHSDTLVTVNFKDDEHTEWKTMVLLFSSASVAQVWAENLNSIVGINRKL